MYFMIFLHQIHASQVFCCVSHAIQLKDLDLPRRMGATDLGVGDKELQETPLYVMKGERDVRRRSKQNSGCLCVCGALVSSSIMEQ